jgi:hypothetical protein
LNADISDESEEEQKTTKPNIRKIFIRKPKKKIDSYRRPGQKMDHLDDISNLRDSNFSGFLESSKHRRVRFAHTGDDSHSDNEITISNLFKFD